MPASEIDDIFAGKVATTAPSTSKGKAKAVDVADPSSSTSVTRKKEKSKKRKRQQEGHDERAAESSRLDGRGRHGDKADEDEDDGSEKRKKEKLKRPRVVETVQDPSAQLASAVSASAEQKLPKPKKNKPRIAKDGGKGDDDLGRFKDSRGTGPRTCALLHILSRCSRVSPTGKRTEEGFLVYKEDELGIRDGGGGKPVSYFLGAIKQILRRLQIHHCVRLTVTVVRVNLSVLLMLSC